MTEQHAKRWEELEVEKMDEQSRRQRFIHAGS